jgi:tetratricopeptide (TPR) repeat protein
VGIRLILTVALPVAGAIYILHFNRSSVVELQLADGLAFSLPIVMLVVLSALTGALFASLVSWTEVGLFGFTRWRERRSGRRRARARGVLVRAENLRSRGKIRAARRKAKKAARLDPTLSPAFTLAGDLAADAGDLEEAIRCNERLYSLSPDSLEALVRLSTNLEAVGRHQEAEKMLLRLGENGAVHPDILRRLRDMFAGQGRWDEALAAIGKLSAAWASPVQRAADKRTEGDILMAAGEAKIALSDAKGAAPMLEEAVRCLPSERAPRLRLGEAYQAAGRDKRAVKTWEEGYRHLGEPEFLHRIVAQYAPRDDVKAKRQAASAMIACGRMRAGDPIPLVMAATLLFEVDKGEEARKWLEAATEMPLDQSREDSWVGIVMSLLDARGKLESGDRLGAESAFQKVAKEAGRKILGEPESGFVIRPVETSSAE